MKKILYILFALLFASPTVCAKKMNELKVYVNPGHGGYSGDDRGIDIYPYCKVTEEGYWESKSNLVKGLHLRDILQAFGTDVMMSRIANTEADDRGLATIANEADSWGADMFISIHSNAGEAVNYPLMIYHNGGNCMTQNKRMCEIVNDVFNSSKYSNWINYKGQINTETPGRVTTDYALLGYTLGVIRNLDGVGMLSEGGMHEHRPQAHRLMNDDYNWLEAWYFAKSIMIYFDTEDRFTTGNIAGVVYDDHNTRDLEYNERYASFTMLGRDKNLPMNGAKVELLDASNNVIDSRVTDNDYNGVYVFRNVAPGSYTVRVTKEGYYISEKTVTVVADEVAYQDMPITMKRETPLAVMAYSPNVVEGELVSCSQPIEFEFNWDVDVASFEAAFSIEPPVDGSILYSNSFHKVSFVPTISLVKNTDYTVTLKKTVCTTDNYYSHPQMENDLVFKFRTKDRDGIEVVDMYPQDGGVVHYEKPTFEIRFDNKIKTTNYNSKAILYDSQGNKLSGFNSRYCTKNTLTNGFGNISLVRTANLNIGEKYKLVLLGGGELKDEGDIPLKDQIEIEFTAVDETVNSSGNVLEAFENENLFANNVDETVGVISSGYSRITDKRLFDYASGQFDYKFESNRDGVVVWNYAGTEEKQVEKGDVLGVFVNGDLSNHELYIGVTSGTDTKYEKLCDLNFRGWKYVSVAMNGLEKSETVPYYLLSHIKLVQVVSPITQNGGFALDNLMRDSSAGIEDVIAETAEQVKVYPNPASDVINVVTSADVKSLELVNIQGIKVADAVNANELAVDNLPQGLYILKVGTDKSMTKHRVVISR